MNFEKDDVVKLNDGIEYLIVDTTFYNDNKYLYLSRLDIEEFALVKLENRDNSFGVSKLSDEEYNTVLDLLKNQNSEN